jgi:UDP-N-acetyl-D-glucosamine/UDP-N-acetyl-D-galactosamine dehydrogenase
LFIDKGVMEDKTINIGVIGLGYVGLPLAIEFGKKYPTIGFDVKKGRIDELKQSKDSTHEVDENCFKESVNLAFTTQESDLKGCNYYIVTVPTPIDKNNRPDLTPLVKASELIGKIIKKGDIVIYESTVYPGCTEEDCIPVIEKVSGLIFNQDFYCGYSPERINPGDKLKKVTDIKKITSGSTPEIAQKVNELYHSIIKAGTHLASSIRVAEAAKVIENAQRDINIAFVNELAIIFHKMGIDSKEVLEAAGTKWNFLPFHPGLVGGHCIGVDPYYLTHKAQEVGYHPEIILAGRRLNDNMGIYVASRLLKLMIKKGIGISKSKVLILGITFKENCPDIRNTRVTDIIAELVEYGCDVSVFDPVASSEDVVAEYKLNVVSSPEGDYDAVILAVAHNEFKHINVKSIVKKNHVIFDVKSFLPKHLCDERL